jgi:anti-sigma regulatory factor (Ser/Thr protein kinase)
MKNILIRFFGGVKGLVFIFAIAIGLSLHLYTQHIVNQLRDEARSLVLFYAQMYARVADTESPDDLSFIFDEIIVRTNFPLIHTNVNKNPVGWKGIGEDPADRSEETINRIKRLVMHLDREIDPVPIRYKDMLLGYLYYGDSKLIEQLQWLPYVEVGLIGLFILLGFFGYANIKKSEQRHIWVGMAKETAHQLGTPISSLMGWLEIMRSGEKSNRSEMIQEIEKDLQRLHRVSKRFSQIGSKPVLKKTEIIPVLKEVVEYIKRRIPRIGRQVIISESYEEIPQVDLNTGLFQWAVENVMKNALDALDKEKGNIEIRSGFNGKSKKIYIDIKDNGKGVEGSDKRRIFKPGYSTKKRGWGLGLSLAKRIVEDYHGGKLFLKESRPGEGTTIRIEIGF